MTARPRRSTASKVNYAKYADSGATADDDEGYVGAGQEPSDDEMSDAADIPDDEDEGDAEADEDIGDVIDEELKAISKKSKSKKSSTKPKKAPKAFKAQVTASATSDDREIRYTRQITNVKDKILRLFGNNKEKLIEIIRLRRDWDRPMFDFPQNLLQEYRHPHTLKNIPSIKANKSNKTQFEKNLSLTRKINLQYNDESAQKLSAGSIKANKRATIINTGGTISDIAWFTTGSERKAQYLASSVTDIIDNSAAPEFALLGGQTYKSGILIYELDPRTQNLKLVKALYHGWGNAWDLHWIDHEGLGVISAVFNDGKVRLFKLDDDLKEDNIYAEITEPSFEYSLPGTLITTYDWIDDKIICGTDKGQIAEFVLMEALPSYLYPVHSGYIFSLKAGVSKYDETMIYTACSDGLSALFSTKDIGSTRNLTLKSRSVTKSVAYSPQLYSFIQLEGQYMTKLTPARALFFVTPIVKHEGSTETVATSNLHPMMLSGGAEGRIKISNIVRRLLNGQKQALSSHKILTLWELQYGAKEDLYRLVDNFEVEGLSVNDPTSSNIYPSTVSINTIKWNENMKAGKWYAAGTTSGLLILEHLGS